MEWAVLILHPIAQYLITWMLIKLCIPRHKLRPFYRSLHVHTWSDFIRNQTTVDDFAEPGVTRCRVSYSGILLNLGLGLTKSPWWKECPLVYHQAFSKLELLTDFSIGLLRKVYIKSVSSLPRCHEFDSEGSSAFGRENVLQMQLIPPLIPR